MAGSTDIYAFTEMNRRAEEYTLKARSELFRIGCSPEKLKVLRQGPFLQMQYARKIILTDPCSVLIILKKSSVGLAEEEVWERVVHNVRQVERQNKWIFGWIVVGCAGLLSALVYVLLSAWF